MVKWPPPSTTHFVWYAGLTSHKEPFIAGKVIRVRAGKDAWMVREETLEQTL
jgi:hypothetical protein